MIDCFPSIHILRSYLASEYLLIVLRFERKSNTIK